MSSEVVQTEQRKANLEAITRLGFAAYPSKFDTTHSVSELVAGFTAKSAADLEAPRVDTVTAGRVISVRSFGKASFLVLSDGRFFSEVDDLHKRNVMVIGVNVAEALFPGRTNVAGTPVRLGDEVFEIVGVMEKRKGSFFGENSEDNAIYIPYETGKKLSPGSEWMLLIIRAKTGQIASAVEQSRRALH